MFKEISLKEINNYKDSISLFEDGAIALATSKDNKTNGLTIGWGAIGVLWSKPCATVYIHKTRYSKVIFDNSEYFSICFFENHLKELSYFGSVSGKDEDKIKNGGLSLINDDIAPYFEEAKLVILCKKMGQSDFDLNNISESRIIEWYKGSGVHTAYYGEIIKILKSE